jgi:hypothetical protein
MTIRNINEFRRWTERQIRQLQAEQVPQFQQFLGLQLLRSVVLKSPVGNPDLWQNPDAAPPGYVGGRFRANWQIGLSPDEPEVDSTDISTALSQIAPLPPPGETLWVFNNVPYAARLENGWSQQAPTGIVSLALAEIAAS